MRIVALLLLGVLACGESAPIAPPVDRSSPPPQVDPVAPARPNPGTDAPAEKSFQISDGRSVQWKRYAALEADLMRALELSRDEICKELGTQSCIRDVHLVPLGGSDSFRSGLHKPPQAPLSTTPLVVDRVALSACSARVRADKAGPAKVFTGIDLAGPASDGLALITTLSRRLLARDPTERERDLLQGLLAPGQTAEEFAVLACFTLATSLEFLFY